jgi:phosphoribosylaminoimidazole carboxylase PurE protein
MATPLVYVIMGSDSDLEIMQEAAKVLAEFGVPHEVQVMSAHRSPDVVSEFAKNARQKGVKVVIAGAGGAAHLAGVVAAHTTIPVIGVPITSTLNGLDSLLSTVQMPSGIPVATVAVGKSGAANAAILAVQMLALSNAALAEKLETKKKELARSVEEKNKKLRDFKAK